MKELKIVNELDLGVPVRGSYVVGNYIYILADVLYRAPISGDSVGELEPLNSIVNPNSIISDGTYLYVSGGSVSNPTFSYLFAVRVSDFTLLVSLHRSNNDNRVAVHGTDKHGNVHYIDSNATFDHFWRVYRYYPENNMFTLVNSVSFGSVLTGLTVSDDHVILHRGNGFLSYLYSWDGQGSQFIYSSSANPYRWIYDSVVYKGKFFGAPYSGSLGALFGLGEENFETIDSFSYASSQRSIDTDGDYCYSYGSGVLSAIKYVETNLTLTQQVAFSDNSNLFRFPNQVHCGNNRVYVANGNKLYTLRWHVKAGFTVSNSNPAVGETITFSAIQ